MATKRTQSQHQLEDSRSRTLSEARREIHQLRKQNAQLQKKVKRLAVAREEQEADAAEEGLVPAVPLQAENLIKCCPTPDLRTVSTPGGKILKICKSCKARHS